METEVKGSLADVKRLVADLRPTTLEQLGLAEALRRYAETVTQRSEGTLKVLIELPDVLPLLPSAVEVAAYRIVLEAVTNVARHAGASQCTVAVTVTDGSLCLAVTDNGCGLPPGGQASGHRPQRLGLRSMAERATELGGQCTVGEVSDGPAAVTRACELGVDVVLMDLHMPGGGGIDATRQLAARSPGTAVPVLTMFDNDESLFTAMRAGARGYLVKGADREEIVRAVQAIAAGDVVFGAGVAARALAYFAAAPAGGRAARPFPELTDREVEILHLIADGRSNLDIARRLHLADKTVRNHVSNVFAKLQVTDRSQAIVRAREAGLGTTGGS